MGFLIENILERLVKIIFTFCMDFTLLVIAAFSDIVANTFNGFNADGSKIFQMQQQLQFLCYLL